MYIHIKTLIPFSEQELRARFPQTSFADQFVAPDGYAYLFFSPTPPYDATTQSVRQGSPRLTEKGTWEQTWEVFKLPDDAIKANQAAKVQSVKSGIVQAVQQRLDDFAKTRNYDGILSACTYATSTIAKFKAEGQAAVDLRDATWATLYQIMDDVEAGKRPMPSGYSDIEPLLPVLTWPV